MMDITQDETWEKVSTRRKELHLLARGLSEAWLEERVPVFEISLDGELRDAFKDLLDEPQNKDLFQPTGSLRSLLGRWSEGVVSVDPRLGLPSARLRGPQAAPLSRVLSTESIETFRKAFAGEFKRWFVDMVVPKATNDSHAIGTLYDRFSQLDFDSDFLITQSDAARRRADGLDFDLVACEIAAQLEGLEPYEGFGPLERVVHAFPSRYGRRLITRPKLLNNRWVSLRVRIIIGLQPFSQKPYVRFVAEKVNWASKAPTQTNNRPRTAEALLVLPAERASCALVLPLRAHFDKQTQKRSYEFTDAAESILAQNNAGGAKFEDRLETSFDPSQPWIGLPMTTRLYRSMPARTVYESDEYTVLDRCAQACAGALEGALSFRELTVRALRKAGKHSMIQIGDIQVAEDDSLPPDGGRLEQLQMYQEALERLHGDRPVHLRIFCDRPAEIDWLKKAIAVRFGESVVVSERSLPQNTHGLREELPAADDVKGRFQLRVEAWQAAVDELSTIDGPKAALICAPDQCPGRRPEEPINRFAGIRAFCQAGIDVHHLLPIAGERTADIENFLQRGQSALLDVLFAHAGAVLPIAIESAAAPSFAYGVQAITTAGQQRRGERARSFLVLTRLRLSTGTTDVRFAVPEASGFRTTDWEPFNQGLHRVTSPDFAASAERVKDREFLAAAVPKWLAGVLREINAQSDRSVVLLCWDTMREMLPFKDHALRARLPPDLLGVPLAQAYPNLAVVRVRGDDATPSVRTRMQVRFQRSRGSAGVEVDYDDYFTSTKAIVELTQPGLPPGVGHYVVGMAYGGNAALARGLSAFQKVQRFAEAVSPACSSGVKRGKVYDRRVLEPGSKDVSVPSPTDLIVLCAPESFPPELVVQVVVGLREGYVHYRSWTRLPVPLFFEKKLRDHVLRLDLEEDDPVEATAPVAVTTEETEEGDNSAVEDLLGDTLAIQPNVVPVQAAETPSPYEGGEQQAETAPASVSASIADQVAGKGEDELPPGPLAPLADRLIALANTGTKAWSTNSLLGKKVRKIVRGELRVRVPLPQFATRAQLFGQEMPPSKKLRRGIASGLQGDQLIRAGHSLHNDVYEWLVGALQAPVSVKVLRHVMNALGVSGLFHGGTVSEAALEETIASNGDSSERRASKLLSESLDPKADAARAWVLMSYALEPDNHGASIVRNFQVGTGPMLDQAVDYLERVIQAVEALVSSPKSNAPLYLPAKCGPSAVNVLAGDEADAHPAEATAPGDSQRPQDQFERAARYRFDVDTVAAMTSRRREINMFSLQEIEALSARALQEADGLRPGQPGFWAAYEALLSSMIELAKAQQAAELEAQRLLEEQRRREMEAEAHAQAEMVENAAAAVRRREVLQGFVDTLAVSILADGETVLLDECGRWVAGEPGNDTDKFLAELDQLSAAWNAVLAAAERFAAVQGKSRKERLKLEGELLEKEEAFRLLAEASTILVAASLDAPDPVVAPSAPIPVVAPAVAATASSIEVTPPRNTSPTAAAPASDPPTAAPTESPLASDIPEPESEAEDDDDVEPEAVTRNEAIVDVMPEEDLDKCLDVLHRLVLKRRYGLAASHATALTVGVNTAEFALHKGILIPLMERLDEVVCAPRVDLPLSPDWYSRLASFTENDFDQPLCNNEGVAMAVMAATLTPLCFSEQAGSQRAEMLQAILMRLGHRTATANLLKTIGEIDRGLGVLTISDCQGLNLGVEERRRKQRRSLEERAGRWQEGREVAVSFSHAGSQAVNSYLFSTKAPMGQAIAAIAAGDIRKLEQIRKDHLEKFDEGREIDRAADAIRERRRVDGHFRNQIINNLKIAKAFIKEYSELVASVSPATKPNGRRAAFLSTLHSQVKACRLELDAVGEETRLERVYRLCLSQALETLDRIYTADETPRCMPRIDQRLLINQLLDRSLTPAVQGERPLAQWNVTLAETDALAIENFGEDGSAGGQFEHLLAEAFRDHLLAGRFFPASLIIDRLRPDKVLLSDFRIKRTARKEELRQEIVRARAIVGQALQLAAIESEAATQMEALLRFIEGHIDVIGTSEALNSDSDIVDFEFASTRIRDEVLRRLQFHLSGQAEALRERLELLSQSAESKKRKADIQHVNKILDGTPSPSVLVMAADAITRLEHGEDLLLGGAASPLSTLRKTLDDFAASVAALCTGKQDRFSELQSALERPVLESDPGWRKTLSPERLKVAKSGLTAWRKLFLGATALAHQLDALTTLSGHLGLPPPTPAHGGAIQPMGRWVGSPFLGLREGFLPPELGSHARSVCIFADRQTSTESLQALVAQVSDGEPTIVVTRRRLSWEERGRLARHGKKILVVDEILALFALCAAPVPQRALLDVGLQFYPARPYKDYGDLPAPKEMFFGRQEEMRRLREIPAASILYGGRRLGKTSLLYEVASQLNAQKLPGSFAAVFSCSSQLSNPKPLTGVWQMIEEQLRKAGAVGASAPFGSTATKIADHVERELAKGEAKDVFLLIDEVDNIERNDGDIGNGIRSLARRLSDMIESLAGEGVRLRYCLAGLHDLARMSDESNSILGKATTLALEPYFSRENLPEGFKLIMEPMAALGYQWQGDTSLVYRILTTCNFYPAFLQLYCENLLEHMQGLRENAETIEVPVTITAKHLDDVEHSSSFLEKIRERFAINLKLDTRYFVIALVLAQRFYDTQNSEAARDGVEVLDIRRECEFWAPKHFKDLGSGAFLSLLHEMQKLTILNNTGVGYRLRNPNIAMMIGNKAQVEQHLLTLGQDVRTARRTNGDRLQQVEGEIFPLPDGLLRDLIEPLGHASVKLRIPVLIGNKLSGLSSYVGFKDHCDQLFDGTAVFSAAKGRRLDSRDIGTSSRGEGRPSRHLWLVGEGWWEISDGSGACQIRRRSDQLLTTRRRLILEASAVQAWALANHVVGVTTISGLQDELFDLTPIPLWSQDTLYFLGENYIEAGQEEIHQRIIRVSGGVGEVARYLYAHRLSSEQDMIRAAIEKVCAGAPQSCDSLFKAMGFVKILEHIKPLEFLLGYMHGELADSDALAFYLTECSATPAHYLFAQWMGLVRTVEDGRWAVPGFARTLMRDSV